MLKKIFKLTISGIIFSSAINTAFADQAANLLEVYRQGLQNDPTFKQAEANMLATRQNVPINLAALLPTLLTNGGINRQILYTGTGSSNYNTQTNYSLSLSQTIFNYTSWKNLSNARAAASAAEATYSAAAQTLMNNIATAYFNVLQASDILVFTLAQKRMLARQLEQTNQRYKVGLIAITDVYQARAAYDRAVASEISARNTIAINLEILRQITGHTYTSLMGPTDHLPLVRPVPNNIEQWVRTAERQNYTLLSARYNLAAAEENIKAHFGGHLPTLSATGSYGGNSNTNSGAVMAGSVNVAGSVGLSVNFPVYQGGLVSAQTKQAEYQYQAVAAGLELTHRSVTAQTRQAYLNVIANISKIEADKQAVLSNQTALKATEASYVVGAKTIVDVLTAQQNLFHAQQTYAQDSYTYLNSTIQLKQAAGTLQPNDLAIINSWLKKPVDVTGKSVKYYGTAGNVPRMLEDPEPYSATPISNTPEPPLLETSSNNKHDAGQSNSAAKIIKDETSTNTAATENVHSGSVKSNTRLEKSVTHSKYYTIQIASLNTSVEAQNFIKRNQLDKIAFVFPVNNNGQIHYKIVYGKYLNLNAAKTALSQLPQKFQANKPWIRKVGS